MRKMNRKQRKVLRELIRRVLVRNYGDSLVEGDADRIMAKAAESTVQRFLKRCK